MCYPIEFLNIWLQKQNPISRLLFLCIIFKFSKFCWCTYSLFIFNPASSFRVRKKKYFELWVMGIMILFWKIMWRIILCLVIVGLFPNIKCCETRREIFLKGNQGTCTRWQCPHGKILSTNDWSWLSSCYEFQKWKLTSFQIKKN